MTERICSVDGCGRLARARGLCTKHYSRWTRHGDVSDPAPRAQQCTVDGCGRPPRGRGLFCDLHRQRLRLKGEVGASQPLKVFAVQGVEYVCKVDGCDRPPHSPGMDYCDMHRERFRRRGSVELRGKAKGADHWAWTGDGASYEAVHFRVKKSRGRASGHTCVACPSQAYVWAYDHLDASELVDIKRRLTYSLHPGHYQPMCTPCHVRFDRRHAKEYQSERAP